MKTIKLLIAAVVLTGSLGACSAGIHASVGSTETKDQKQTETSSKPEKAMEKSK